jgi:hypothetical protein
VKKVAMTTLIILSILFAGFAVGLVMGLTFLWMDRHREKRTRMLNIKDGITVEYDCSHPGIYETIKSIIDAK